MCGLVYRNFGSYPLSSVVHDGAFQFISLTVPFAMNGREKSESESTGTFITYSSMHVNIRTFSRENYYLWLHFVAFTWKGRRCEAARRAGEHTKTLLFILCMAFQHTQITLIKNCWRSWKTQIEWEQSCECVQIFDKAWMCVLLLLLYIIYAWRIKRACLIMLCSNQKPWPAFSMI